MPESPRPQLPRAPEPPAASSRGEAVAALVGGLAHELNNLLSANGMLLDLLAGLCTQERDREIVESVGESIRQGTGLVRQLVWLARGDESAAAVFQPRHLLVDVERMVRSLSSPRLTVTSDLAPDLWPLRCDAIEVYRGFLALCLAARPPRGSGKLVLSAVNVEIDEVEASLRGTSLQPGPYVVLEATGPREAGPLPPAAEERFAACGGISETKALPGSRQALRVFLPALPEALTGDRWQPRSPISTRAGGEAILLAEDNTAVRLAMGGVLERGAYRPLLAADGAQALALCAGEPGLRAAVVGADLRFLEGSGVVRALGVLRPDLPALGLGTPDEIAAWPDDLGTPAAFLAKPFQAASLLAAVDRLVGGDQSVNPLSSA